jgi:carbonic anhydrase
MAQLSRRRMFGLGLGVAAMTAAAPAFAVDQGYEAMLVKCIDPRFTTDTWKYMTGRGWQNLYSQFNIAGGPIGVVAPAFAKWHDTYWDNLAISVQLHSVKRVVGITHRDCGAAAVAYGDRIKTDKAYETEMNTKALRQFRDEVKKRQPQVIVELGIMDLSGAVEPVT